MCRDGRVSGPRWSRLYAIAIAMVASVGLADRFVRPGLRTLVEVAVIIGGMLAMLGWVHASRVALDGLDWCDCARATVRMHVVESRPAGPVRGAGEDAAVAPGEVAAGKESCLDLVLDGVR